MSIKEHVHFLKSGKPLTAKIDSSIMGVRGRALNELASLALPIVPGIIIDSEFTHLLGEHSISPALQPLLKKCAKLMQKKYDDAEDPLLLKIVFSSNLVIANYPRLHNIGLTKQNIVSFMEKTDQSFACHEIYFLLKGLMYLLYKLAEIEEKKESVHSLKMILAEIDESLEQAQMNGTPQMLIERYENFFPEGFFDDAHFQLEETLKLVSRLLAKEKAEDTDHSVALVLQPMVYGNYGTDSYAGFFFTRNSITGKKCIEGKFFKQTFDEHGEGVDITEIDAHFFKALSSVAEILETHYHDIRFVRFTIEQGQLWLIEHRLAQSKTTHAQLQLILDLYENKLITINDVVTALNPRQLHEVLHPIIDMDSVANAEVVHGGIAGASGAAVGRVYFSANALLTAKKNAQLHGTDEPCILCMPATFAGDVKAIEVAAGVLSTEGGYAAHASVVARQYGKTSLVLPQLQIHQNSASILGKTIAEGDYLTLDVPYHGECSLYFGKGVLREPDIETSRILDFIDIVKTIPTSCKVQVNADTAEDATKARLFGARGVGLCRTEHMFFAEERINLFRALILSTHEDERKAVLDELKVFQRNDFYALFKEMEGSSVTIRLLDAPLHEFLPHSSAESEAFLAYLRENSKNPLSEAELHERIALVQETNPMLAHRGCRLAISYPEIYHMQAYALFEAAEQVQQEGGHVSVDVMIPLVMNWRELKQIRYGKKIEGSQYLGIESIAQAFQKKLQKNSIQYRIGSMIELPAAALSAGDIARYAQFFSFGTNDLTQTTLGLSRDDINTFLPDYTLYDLVDANPFVILDDRVKELISTAVLRARLSRPHMHIGLCGEHGAVPENIQFCLDVGLNYVSCSTYSVPIALLAIAQAELKGTTGEKAGLKKTKS